jgi:hypothetical protein
MDGPVSANIDSANKSAPQTSAQNEVCQEAREFKKQQMNGVKRVSAKLVQNLHAPESP